MGEDTNVWIRLDDVNGLASGSTDEFIGKIRDLHQSHDALGLPFASPSTPDTAQPLNILGTAQPLVIDGRQVGVFMTGTEYDPAPDKPKTCPHCGKDL